jgi:hypothetical protein
MFGAEMVPTKMSQISKRRKLFPAPFFITGLAISAYVLCVVPSVYPASDYIINSATVTINSGSLNVNGNITISGKLDVSTGTISLSGNWSNNNTFTCGTSTVNFIGTGTSTLSGSSTFYVLVSTTSGKTVNLSSATVTYVTNLLNLKNVTLRSTLQGATWYLTLSGTQDVSSVDVKDSNASGGNTIIAYDSTDSGNNTNWDFGPPAAITDLTGLCNSSTGNVTLSWSTPGDDGWNKTLVNGSKYRIDYSTYSIAWSTSTFDVEISTSGVAPHTQVSRTITGLTGDSTYYFRIWTADEIPLWSGLSNGATVWVNPIISISISTETYAFGTIECATSTVSGSTTTVTNDGNITETYSIKCSSTTKWTPQDTPGPNQFTLQSAFHSSQPANNDLIWKADDILSESLKACTTAVFSIDGTEHGKNVPPFDGDIKKLWFRLQTPLSTSTTDQQTITITISAQSP